MQNLNLNMSNYLLNGRFVSSEKNYLSLRSSMVISNVITMVENYLLRILAEVPVPASACWRILIAIAEGSGPNTRRVGLERR